MNAIKTQSSVERLVRAVNRGVRVRIMARAPHKLSGKKLAQGIGGLRIMHDVGAKVHLLRHLKLHGKIVIADGKQAIVGSINLSPGSFDSRRELAIETRSKPVLKRLVQVSRRDWMHSRRLDLSDVGILADLEKHGSKDADVLALGHTKPAELETTNASCRNCIASHKGSALIC
jgi:cardiolipin synthase A/B